MQSKKTKYANWKRVDGETCAFLDQLTRPFFRLIVNLFGQLKSVAVIVLLIILYLFGFIVSFFRGKVLISRMYLSVPWVICINFRSNRLFAVCMIFLLVNNSCCLPTILFHFKNHGRRVSVLFILPAMGHIPWTTLMSTACTKIFRLNNNYLTDGRRVN